VIKDTQPFIDLGWHTIPLRGTLERLPDGKKTTPGYTHNWKEKAAEFFNEDATPLGGALTGKVSGIIAIDCDDTVTYDLFKALDPDYNFHFVSVGKKDLHGNDVESGTIVYKYHQDLPDSFKVSSARMKLDFLSNNGMIFLPTEANKTKAPFVMQELKEPPPAIIAVLAQMYVAKTAPQAKLHLTPRSRFNLAPLVHQFVQNGGVPTKALFRTLTPKEFRSELGYLENGYLHPDEIPDGSGSTYLSQVSAILGADASVDEELYIEAMVLINQCFSVPMDTTRLEATIMDRMVAGKATGADGTVIWQYDKNWEENSRTFHMKSGDIANIFYDYKRLIYYCIDLVNEDIIKFETPHKLAQHLSSVTTEYLSSKDIVSLVPSTLADSRPELDFGFFSDDNNRNHFNVFASTTPYKIFKNPDEYEAMYKRPTMTIRFFESLIPDEHMRGYFLGFIKRKLHTFDYSPVILYFLGASGSGKDTAVKLIQRILGMTNFATPSAKEFLEAHNGWLVDKSFVQLNEFGDQLTSARMKEEALGRLKSYTGANTIQIRQMHTDGYLYEHKTTFIMTSNRNPLMLDVDDRRIALFHTPNKLVAEGWVAANGGISSVIDQIEKETNDFCYYLATEVAMISADEYNTPPASKDKERLIAESMTPAKRLAFYMKTKSWGELRSIFDLYAPLQIIAHLNEGKVLEADLIETYENMAGGEAERPARAVRQAMIDMGFTQMRTTMNGVPNVYYYVIPGIRQILDYPSEISEDA